MGFQDQLSINAGQKYCRMLQGDHSALRSTFIKLPIVIKIFVLSIFEWPLKTGFTVLILLVGDWDTASSFRTIPVRTEVRADKLYPNGTVYNLHHIYDFYNYNYYVDNDATVFEVSILE